MRETVNILGVKFDNTSRAGAETTIKERLSEGKYLSVFTPNPTIVMRAYGSDKLTYLLNSAELSVADGIGIILAARLLGTPLPERIAGIELGETILSMANEMKLRVFLLGGKVEEAQKAAENIRCKYPELTVCGTHHGYFDKENDNNDEVIAKIKEASPDILFVCFGFPTQELWISQNHTAIPSLKLCAGLGGSIDVWAGDIRRAPKLIRAMSLEWLWRMMLQPKRTKDIWSIARFLICVFRQKKQTRRSFLDKKA